jgi:prevent-host-death family protein
LHGQIDLTSLVIMRETAAVAELKAHLSRYLRRVKAGEEILITERGVPVARIVPARSSADEGLLALERQGRVRVGTATLPKNFWKLPRGKDPDGLVRAAVSEEREGGW